MVKKSLIGLSIVALLVTIPAIDARVTKKKVDDQQFQIKLSKDRQITHAIDRLTFGARPGDFATVQKLGLKKWIDLQLNPSRIKENPILEAKLAPLLSLQMTEIQAVQNYPSRQMIIAVARGKEKLPEDPLLRNTVQRLVQRYRAKINPDDKTVTDDEMEPVTPIDQLIAEEQLKTLRNGTADKKREVLAGIAGDQMEAVVLALPRNLRQQLFNLAPETMRRMIMISNAPQQLVAYDLSEGKLFRAIYSNRQLQEELVDFWYNHFNVYLDKGADRFQVPTYERDAIRPHVLGSFRDFLEATAKSPAMLFYLDNWQSVGPPKTPKVALKGPQAKRPARGLNENYGRELLELHTLGVDGGYTQKDVTEVARCFTGWTIREPRKGGSFDYNDKVHDKGEKIVLGVTIPAGGGMDDGEKVLDILARHPSTARFISTKLAKRFVSDTPPQALIDRMAKTFHDKKGDLREVMKTMLSSKEFWSEGAYRAKVKTPFEMIASAVRALNADVEFSFPLSNQIAALGQPLYRKQEPTGYSSANAEWINSAALLARMNFALSLTQNKVAGVKVDQQRFNDAAKDDPMGVARAVLFQDVSPQTRLAIETALKAQQAKNPKEKPAPAVIAGLVIGSPEFQRR